MSCHHQTVENKTWRIRDLRDTDISSQKEDILKVVCYHRPSSAFITSSHCCCIFYKSSSVVEAKEIEAKEIRVKMFV